jgi:alkaline phosphatase
MPLNRFSWSPITSNVSCTSSHVEMKSSPSADKLRRATTRAQTKPLSPPFPNTQPHTIPSQSRHNLSSPTKPRDIISSHPGNDGAYMVSILASYWRASNWEPSGAEPAILFHNCTHQVNTRPTIRTTPTAAIQQHASTSTASNAPGDTLRRCNVRRQIHQQPEAQTLSLAKYAGSHAATYSSAPRNHAAPAAMRPCTHTDNSIADHACLTSQALHRELPKTAKWPPRSLEASKPSTILLKILTFAHQRWHLCSARIRTRRPDSEY